MKRRDLIRILVKNGWWLERRGAKHDIFTNGLRNEPIPRHNDIDELLAKAILKRQGLN